MRYTVIFDVDFGKLEVSFLAAHVLTKEKVFDEAIKNMRKSKDIKLTGFLTYDFMKSISYEIVEGKFIDNLER